jgi:hypothetical protein
VKLPGPGGVSLASVAGKKATASAAKAKKIHKPRQAVKKATRAARAAGPLKLPVVPTGAGLSYLKAKHSLRAKVAVTFTPTGGTAKTVTKTVVLKLAKPRHKQKKHHKK